MTNRLLLSSAASVGGGPFTDDFNRADNDSLGANWTETTGDLDIASNAVIGFAANNEARYESSVGSVDMYAQAVAYRNGATTVDDNARVLVRFGASDRVSYGFVVRCAGSAANRQLYKRSAAGVYTQIATESATPRLEDGDVLRLEVVGTSLVAKINGTTVMSTTDSTITTNTRGGIFTAGSIVTMDNFETGEL